MSTSCCFNQQKQKEVLQYGLRRKKAWRDPEQEKERRDREHHVERRTETKTKTDRGRSREADRHVSRLLQTKMHVLGTSPSTNNRFDSRILTSQQTTKSLNCVECATLSFVLQQQLTPDPDYSTKDRHFSKLEQLLNSHQSLASNYFQFWMKTTTRRVVCHEAVSKIELPRTTSSASSESSLAGSRYSTNNRPSGHNTITTLIACICTSACQH